ncbi:MAG: hypothetical protein B6247_09910 [Candidatus Parabeggiatoa sp. nov. 2]|nr:MAG: hypothetical protein B6247_09910 [Beggiatoa sp. 4572_84]
MLTLETDRILSRLNGAKSVGHESNSTSVGHESNSTRSVDWISFLQRTGQKSNPRQLGAMLTLETDRILSRLNGAKSVGHERRLNGAKSVGHESVTRLLLIRLSA